MAHVGCLFSTHRTSLGVHQHTQDVCGCPWLSVSTHRTFVAVRVCSYVSVSTHRTSVCDRVCLCVSVSLHRTSMAVRVCPCVSVCVHQHTQDGRGCKSVHISARWSLDSARWPFPWIVRVILAHVGCLFSTHRTSVGVCQHTQVVCGCPCVSVRTHRTSVAAHQYTCRHVGPWTQHAGPSRGLFG